MKHRQIYSLIETMIIRPFYKESLFRKESIHTKLSFFYTCDIYKNKKKFIASLVFFFFRFRSTSFLSFLSVYQCIGCSFFHNEKYLQSSAVYDFFY